MGEPIPISGLEFVVEEDLSFCRRRAVDFARRAVYSRDRETRRALARMAQGWAELARAVESVEPISPEFRLAAEIGYSATKKSFERQTKAHRPKADANIRRSPGTARCQGSSLTCSRRARGSQGWGV